MKFLKKIWRKFRGIFIKRPPSTEKIISEEKAVLERPVNTTEIFTQIAESENENERASLISKKLTPACGPLAVIVKRRAVQPLN